MKLKPTESDGGVCLVCRNHTIHLNGTYYCGGWHPGDEDNKPTASEIDASRRRHPSFQSN